MSFSTVPRTAMLLLNYDNQGEETLTLAPLEKIQFPVCRTGSIPGANGGFFDLKELLKWWQIHGTDPITRQPMDWNHYEAVQWVGDDVPPTLHRLYNHRATEYILEMLKQSDTGGMAEQRAAVVRRCSTLLPYVIFRRFMARMAADIYGARIVVEWLREYWVCHPYDSNTEADTVGRILPGNFRFAPPNNHHLENAWRLRFFAFRNGMARLYGEGVDDDIVSGYWNAHPLLDEDSLQTRRLFQNQAEIRQRVLGL